MPRAEQGGLAASIREIERMRERAEHQPVPYWVHLDAAAEGLFAQGEDGVALAAVHAGMGLGYPGLVPTSRADVTWVRFCRPLEWLACDRSFLAAVVRSARLSGRHGTARRCGTRDEKGF